MKIIITLFLLLINALVFSQEKINSTILKRISSESSSKYKKELSQYQKEFQKSNPLNKDLTNSFAGYVLGGPVFYQTNDSRQAIATNTDLLYNNSIPGVQVAGSGMKVYIWDGGNVRATHNDLTGRVTNMESLALSDHSSGVAGVIMGAGLRTIGGVNSRGMAYQSTLNAYSFNNNIAEISNESADLANADYMVSNHSYGAIAGWAQGDYGMGNGWYWFGSDLYSQTESIYFGYYGADDSSLDDIAFNSPQHTIVKSAGNDNHQGPGSTLPQHWAYNSNWVWQEYNNVFRPNDCGQTGYDCIPTSSLAKNIITVGAINVMSGRYTQSSDVVAANFTNYGPADDGRIKPDVVAVGVGVLAPGAGNNNQYYNWDGTSFSAPAVTGNIVLLQELYEEKYGTYLRSDLTKAIVIHTANESGDTPGPDYKFGWGLMDSKKSAELIIGKDETSILNTQTLNDGEAHQFSVRGIENSPLKVTIVWLDPVAPVGAGHNDRTPQLINDLDLRISDGLVDYFPWKLDVNNPSAAATKGDNVLDNVEQIIIDNPIEGLNYEIEISHKGNLQNGSQVFAVVVSGASFCPFSTTWDGLSWSNDLPDSQKKAIIDGAFTLNSNLETCDIEVTENGKLIIPDGLNLTVNGGITNKANASDFLVESGANLIQNIDSENVGDITVMRDSQPMKRLDYTMWSSPLTGQQLQAFSPDTLPNRIYTYEGVSGYVVVPSATANFDNGKGYLFRAPNNANSTFSTPYQGKFVGTPLNGKVIVNTVSGSFTSTGNPYPSNINADLLMAANPSILGLFYWTNVNPVSGGTYIGNNYASYTHLGGTSADGGTVIPDEFISVGQGFIVETTNASISFDNTMRVGDTALFFKMNEIEKHRIWLNLSNEQNQGFNQILLGYMTGATNAIDSQIDGKQFRYNGSALYNIIGEEKFTIQGRALPFEKSDVVQLGFKAAEAGKFTISLSQFDGLFAEGEVKIYLKDSHTDAIHNLMESPYTFESNEGEFKSRFELVYQTAEIMGTSDLTSNSVQIYTHNDQIVVSSKSEKILSVELFDLSGRNLHRNEKMNSNHYEFQSASKGVLVVRVQTKNGEIVTKKVISE